jgi:hypothetical protein
MRLSGIEPATFWLVVQCLNKLRQQQRAPLGIWLTQNCVDPQGIQITGVINTERVQHYKRSHNNFGSYVCHLV